MVTSGVIPEHPWTGNPIRSSETDQKKWNACEQCLIFRVAPILGEWYPQEKLTSDFSDVPMFIFQTSFPLSTPCIWGLGATRLVLGKCGMSTFWLNYMYVEYPS